MGKSARLFGQGLLRHFLYWVPGVFLGLLELVQRETGKPIAVPTWLFWLVLGLGVLLAAFLAFHELRVSNKPDASIEVRRRIADEIGQIINEGEGMANESWWNAWSDLGEANRDATDWWNNTGEFIQTVLGQGERHIISEPAWHLDREPRLQTHCQALRGVLERLSKADLRVDAEGLQAAISTRRAAVKPIGFG